VTFTEETMLMDSVKCQIISKVPKFIDGGSLGGPHIKPLTRSMVRRMEEK